MPNEIATDIYLSHCRDDHAIAKRIAQRLRRRGWSVWLDAPRRISDDFEQQVEFRIDAASAVVVLWSEASIRSAWVIAEANEGLRKRALFPILVSDVKPGRRFRHVSCADMRPPGTVWRADSTQWNRFHRSLEQHMGRRPDRSIRKYAVDTRVLVLLLFVIPICNLSLGALCFGFLVAANETPKETIIKPAPKFKLPRYAGREDPNKPVTAPPPEQVKAPLLWVPALHYPSMSVLMTLSILSIAGLMAGSRFYGRTLCLWLYGLIMTLSGVTAMVGDDPSVVVITILAGLVMILVAWHSDQVLKRA